MLLLLISLFFVAPLVAVVALLWSEGIMLPFEKKKAEYPPFMPSIKYPNQIAGWIETIVALIGTRAPFVVYEGMKKLPQGYPWIVTGKFPNKSPSGCGYAVADVHIAKEILTSPHSRKSVMYDGVDFLTCGFQNIFTANGHRWRHARKFVAPAFSSNHIKRMNRICAEHLEHFINTTLDKYAEEGKAFDVSEEMVTLTLAIISEAAFEYPMSRKEMREFTHNLEVAAKTFVIMNPLHQKFPWLFPAVWRARHAAKNLQALAYRMMDNYRAVHKDKKEHEFRDDTIISRIVNNPNYTCDDERAADIAIFMAAGHDTTAYSISWSLIEIFRTRPAELTEFRNKIAEMPDRDDWRRVTELQYMIKEAMRVYPALAMGTVRDVGVEITYQHGKEKVVLPKDSIYFINLFPMFRNPEYYDDPDEYRPSRWANPKTEEAHIPFSIGSRNCIGQTLANAELSTVLSVLCARYDFELVQEGYPEFFSTLTPCKYMMKPTKLF
ncbi:Leukotriene-B(4) omega-hydroxylase 2 [Seminavis robusta]|uniref:Leukotriene-B(4) omega-hydroxylase 2 n=1 Tax=Seminavis robusta TaxID=568900 RepID=A0A9N8H6E6_9STRA|nr:Leukotriene-B(4) omega-hydroxylase 2 [Seminavis robusta]|eukprot:Sro98_g050340.1 Leukotriene-B(4) omega-hydroxylase 2 (494) ;mRNA; f:26612-28251